MLNATEVYREDVPDVSFFWPRRNSHTDGAFCQYQLLSNLISCKEIFLKSNRCNRDAAKSETTLCPSVTTRLCRIGPICYPNLCSHTIPPKKTNEHCFCSTYMQPSNQDFRTVESFGNRYFLLLSKNTQKTSYDRNKTAKWQPLESREQGVAPLSISISFYPPFKKAQEMEIQQLHEDPCVGREQEPIHQDKRVRPANCLEPIYTTGPDGLPIPLTEKNVSSDPSTENKTNV